jgi:hypothetical protein
MPSVMTRLCLQRAARSARTAVVIGAEVLQAGGVSPYPQRRNLTSALLLHPQPRPIPLPPTTASMQMDRERELLAPADYLSEAAAAPAAERAVTPQMRSIVASWLCEVASEFRMQQETLFLAIALFDKFQAASHGVRRRAAPARQAGSRRSIGRLQSCVGAPRLRAGAATPHPSLGALHHAPSLAAPVPPLHHPGRPA